MTTALTEPQQKALAKLRELYDQVPTFECQPFCADCCGSHLQTEVEWLNISLWLETQDLPYKAWHPFTCPHLHQKRCSIYPVRPMQCRLYGTAISLGCPHGCHPATLLSSKKARNLLSDVIFLLPPASHGTGEQKL